MHRVIYKIKANHTVPYTLESFVPRLLLRMGSWQEFSLIFLSLVLIPLFPLMFPTPFLIHCCFLFLSPSKSNLGNHYISRLLLDVKVLSLYPPFHSLLSLLCMPMSALCLSYAPGGCYFGSKGTDRLAQRPQQHRWDVWTDASVPLGFFSVTDAFTMEIDKHQGMFVRYKRTFGE